MRRHTLGLALLIPIALLGACSNDTTTSTGGSSTGGSSTTSGSTPSTGGATGGTTGATGRATAGAELAGTAWDLVTYQDGSAQVPAATGAASTLAFGTDATVSGSTGCNRFAGTFAVSGSSALTIELGPMTQMACADPQIQDQETALLALLPEVAGFTVDGETLTLTDAGGTVLATYAAGATGLEGTSWQVTGVNNGREAVESSALTEALTMSFGADGTFSGTGGCNQLSGSYTADDAGSLTITGVASTMRACADPEVDTLETNFLTALGKVTTYEISGDQLTLRAADGATQVTATST